MRLIGLLLGVLMLFSSLGFAQRTLAGTTRMDAAVIEDLVVEAIRGLYSYWDISTTGGLVTFATDSTLTLSGTDLVVEGTAAFEDDVEIAGDLDCTGDVTAMGDTSWVLTGTMTADSGFVGKNAETIDNLTNNYWRFVGTGGLVAAAYNFATPGMVTGSADSVVVNFTPDLAALQAGLSITFIAEAANTGATTLIVDGGTEKNIFEAKDVSALEANDIRSGMMVTVIYDGTQWQQISQSGN